MYLFLLGIGDRPPASAAHAGAAYAQRSFNYAYQGHRNDIDES